MLRIELLSRGHDREAFGCGEQALDIYLKRTARQHNEKGISRTFVLIDTEEPARILGFFTLTSCEIVASDLPPVYAKKYPGRAPAAKLARLAVSSDRQRQGLGGTMMVEAMRRTLAVSENIGIIGFFVDAKNQAAREYYEQYGFIPLSNSPLGLFLPLATLAGAVEALEK
ncbi:MAG: GNAT family N-acetyltransferase [Desulfuromonadales bacterium]